MQVELKNFWSADAIGHTNSLGNDPTKHFLVDLFKNVESEIYLRCVITSHFGSQSSLRKLLTTLKRIHRKLNADGIERRRILHGHTSDQYQMDPGAINIWYTSENIRPPLDCDFQLFLSHDLDAYDGRNIYLPFWVTRLGNNLVEAANYQTQLSRSREIPVREGICAIISNPEPIRMAFIRQLSLRHKVDVYGAFGLPVSDKQEILSRYRINICFENSESSGYVTEKPFEAWQAGCVPVWRGLDIAGHLNPSSLINVSKLGFIESINQISTIMESDNDLKKFTEQPLIQKKFDLKLLEKNIKSKIV